MTIGSHAKDVLKWLEDTEFQLTVFPPSDLDIGMKPASGKALSVKIKVQLSMALEALFLLNRVDLMFLSDILETAAITKAWTHDYRELMDETL